MYRAASAHAFSGVHPRSDQLLSSNLRIDPVALPETLAAMAAFFSPPIPMQAVKHRFVRSYTRVH